VKAARRDATARQTPVVARYNSLSIRERLPQSPFTQALVDKVLKVVRKRELLSGQHFTVDGMLAGAWADQ
jgi:hypothetical protein